MVADHQPGGPGPPFAAGHLGPETEQRVLDPAGVDHPGGADDDRVLDLGVADVATGADGAERPDEAVRDLGARPDDGRAADWLRTRRAPASITTRPSSWLSASTSPSMRRSIPSRSRRLASSSGVSFPVSIHHPARTSERTMCPASISHWMASVISSSPRPDGLMELHRLVDLVVEEVHADQGEVRGRHRRLLDQPEHPAGAVQLRHPELLGVVHVGQQDLGGRQERLVVPELRGRRPGPVGLEPGHEVAQVLL